jgi:hypothetical protein
MFRIRLRSRLPHVVPLRAEHERGVVGVVVLGANAGTTVILGAGSERCRMEVSDSSSRCGSEADVSRRGLPAVVRHPEGALAPDAEAHETDGAALLGGYFSHDIQTQRREGLRVEVLGAFEILDGQGDVVDGQVQLGHAASISLSLLGDLRVRSYLREPWQRAPRAAANGASGREHERV